MIPNSWETTPSSFAETVELVANFVKREIIRETRDKQLYYHTIDHAIAVQRRAISIFRAIAPTLSNTIQQRSRLQSLISLSALAHDMVQQFSVSEFAESRKRIPGISEIATAKKLIRYITDLNQALAARKVNATILFSDGDIATIEEAILATICDLDPQAGQTDYSFSPNSIYQPYLYDRQAKISLVGSIVALADLGSLGIEGVEQYIKEGVLVFLEDNLYFQCSFWEDPEAEPVDREILRIRLLNMTQFMVNLARERQARFELEILAFSPQARDILRKQVFIYLDDTNINRVLAQIPTSPDTSLVELTGFFCGKLSAQK